MYFALCKRHMQGTILTGRKGFLPGGHFIDATAQALALGNSILVNIVMLGALSRLNVVPFHREELKEAIATRLATGQPAINLKAFDAGYGMV